MKKLVLFLINGFGIEQKDSYSVYNGELMPNLDVITKEHLFSSIETDSYNLSDAYRVFSIETKETITYKFLDTYSLKLKENPNFNIYLKDINNSNVHIYYFVDNPRFDHLKNIVSTINKTCYIHLVLTSDNTDNYNLVEKFISKVSLELRTCKIATIIGVKSMINDSKSYTTMLKNGIGEKWNEITKKIETLKNSNIEPSNVKPFFMNSDFKLSDETILMINYDNFDGTNFFNNFKEIHTGKIYSMFPIKGVSYPLYNYPSSATSYLSSLHSINAKSLVITNDDINLINYLLNGLKTVTSENILFMKNDNEILYNKEVLNNTLNDPKFNLIIINHTIDNLTMINDLKAKLNKIDTSIKMCKDLCLDKNITFVISSLYGLKKEMYEDQHTKKLVNFSTKVPLIIVDSQLSKKTHTIISGNVSDLKNTCLKLIDNTYKVDGLVRKKSFIMKLLKK